MTWLKTETQFMVKKITSILLFLIPFFGFAQSAKTILKDAIGPSHQHPDGHYRCYTDEILLNDIETKSGFAEQYLKVRQEFRKKRNKYFAQKSLSRAPLADSVHYIPVVVHVVHNNGPENISMAKIQSQIDILNEDYRKLPGTPGAGAGADTKYEFFLAQIDPNGACTDGVIRYQSTQTVHNQSQEFALKSGRQWPPHKYLNMWVVRSINGGNILGYARPPDQLGISPTLDGVVMGYDFFGDVPPVSPPYHLGRTTTHEVGHWLGLPHTFQGGCTGTTVSNCAIAGDGICDTPQSSNPNFGCPGSPPNSCVDQTFGVGVDPADPLENYMNYSDDICMDAFTTGQKDEMDFWSSTVRTLVHDSLNLVATGFYGCFGASITPSASVICEGESVSLTFNLAGVAPFDVYYNDGNQNYILSGVQDGHQEIHMPTMNTTYTVDSMVDSTGMVASNSSSVSVSVNASPTALFTYNQTGLDIGVISQTTGATSLIWLWGDGAIGAGTIANHTYSSPGTYDLSLVATASNSCKDTATETISVTVGLEDGNGFAGRIKVFPNPSKDFLNVEIEQLKNDALEIQLIDSRGRVVYSNEFEERELKLSDRLDTREISQGIYILRITDPKGNSIQERIVIQ